MTNRSQRSGQRTAICHFSLVIGHFSLCVLCVSAVVRKNVAPASSRQTVLLTQKELSRLTCRRNAGATILSHDLRLCGECFWLRLCRARFISGFILRCGYVWVRSSLLRSARRVLCFGCAPAWFEGPPDRCAPPRLSGTLTHVVLAAKITRRPPNCAPCPNRQEPSRCVLRVAPACFQLFSILNASVCSECGSEIFE